MRILGISGVFDTIPTQVFPPTTGFNVNLGPWSLGTGQGPQEIWVRFRVIARVIAPCFHSRPGFLEIPPKRNRNKKKKKKARARARCLDNFGFGFLC